MANKMLHTKAEVTRENISLEEGVIDAVVGSTNVLDRMGDVIDQAGWDLRNYEKNPVILWGHNVREERPPIGKAMKVWVDGKQERTKKLMFKVKFDLFDQFAAEIYRKIKEGFINTVSVGFLPTEWEDLKGSSGPFGGRRYTKQELLELSFVPVPANPEAVIALRSMSKKDDRFAPIELKDLIEDEKEEKPVTTVPPVEGDETPKVETTEPVEEEPKKDEKPKEEAPVEEATASTESDTPTTTVSTGDPNAPVTTATTGDVEPEDIVITPTEEPKVVPVEAPALEEEPKKEPKKEDEEEAPVEEEKEQEIESKKVIPYSDHGTLPDSDGWDGPGEEAKCSPEELKIICAWYDDEKKDDKSAYKLPHHKGDGNHEAVWRGVASAMASLLGARGGADIPEADRKGVYNHLKKHYEQFEKDVPEFKMVEDQVLASLTEEIQAIVLEREEKYTVRLIKKVLKKQNDTPNEQMKKALEVINLALSLYKKDDSLKGGDK